VVVGPREALLTRRIALRDVNWIGDGPLEAAAREERPVFARVRSTRPQQPALLGWAEGGLAVDLVEGEYGVSPGQACVLYDAARGPARVLGGGFIAAAEAAATPPSAAARPKAALGAGR
jgi:tRNA-specific 2-thiouridylase